VRLPLLRRAFGDDVCFARVMSHQSRQDRR
jgi:hypothetical protein